MATLRLSAEGARCTKLCRESGVSPDTALRLARYFSTSAEFWPNLLLSYDLSKTRIEQEKQIVREVQVYTLINLAGDFSKRCLAVNNRLIVKHTCETRLLLGPEDQREAQTKDVER